MRVGGVLCPPSSQFMHPPPPCVHWCLACWLVGLMVFGLLGWLLRWLVGCWLIGSGTAEFGWLVGWFVGWFVGWLVCWLVGCWLVAGVYVCVLSAHMLCGVAAQCVFV